MKTLAICLTFAALLTLSGATADKAPAPEPDKDLVIRYLAARLAVSQAYSPCEAAAKQPNADVQSAIAALTADATAKNSTIADGPPGTPVIYMARPKPAEAKK